jgi:2-dehydropantoate 2-reductase
MSASLPKIVVIGAGAVGCYFGGLMAKGGFPVTFIARENQLEKFKNEGLEIVWADKRETVHVEATTDYETLKDCLFVFICVKTQSTRQTAEEIAPYLKSNAIIISLQNGIDNVGLLKQHISQNCYAGMVYAAMAMTDINQVSHFGGGNLVIGNILADQDASRLDFLSVMLKMAKIPTKISTTMLLELWNKFIVNCSYNGISAIGQISYEDLVVSPGIDQVMNAIKKECIAVGIAEGIDLNLEIVDAMIEGIPINLPTQKSSTAQDIAKSKPTEIDYLNGTIVSLGKKHDIPTPVNSMIYSLIKMREITQGNFSPSSPLDFALDASVENKSLPLEQK